MVNDKTGTGSQFVEHGGVQFGVVQQGLVNAR